MSTRKEDIGPTWRDVEDLVKAIRETFGVSVDMTLTPPCPIPGTRSYTSWRVVTRVWSRPGGVLPDVTTVGTWGYGGASKSAPQALWFALSELYDLLQRADSEATRTSRDVLDAEAGYDD